MKTIVAHLTTLKLRLCIKVIKKYIENYKSNWSHFILQLEKKIKLIKRPMQLTIFDILTKQNKQKLFIIFHNFKILN